MEESLIDKLLEVQVTEEQAEKFKQFLYKVKEGSLGNFAQSAFEEVVFQTGRQPKREFASIKDTWTTKQSDQAIPAEL